MGTELGSNQLVVLRALGALEAKQGRKGFLARAIVDEIWRELQSLEHSDVLGRAARGDPDAALALRVMSAQNIRRAVRSRASRPSISSRRWAQAVEVIHPHRSFRTLEKRGLIARFSEGTQSVVILTDAGRQLAAALSRPS